MDRRKKLVAVALLSSASAVFSACGDDTTVAPKTDAVYKAEVTSGMHTALLADINTMYQAAQDIQTAAPLTQGRGWNATTDAAAIATMKAAWYRAREAYEHIEGAIAPLFPEVDSAIDARYDDYLSDLGAQGDTYLFDGQGVTGMHGMERILWADTTPSFVVDFEKTLAGYKPAAFPANQQEAADFKNKLAAQMVADIKGLRDQWQPQKIDLGGAFQGLIALVNEQQEKVNKASTNEEESRYSQRTMDDIRHNLEGTEKIYELFREWLKTKPAAKSGDQTGVAIDTSIIAGFSSLRALYQQTTGVAIPRPPTSWQAENPSATDLASPFGKLYTGIHQAVDPAKPGSLVFLKNEAASLLGLPTLQSEESK